MKLINDIILKYFNMVYLIKHQYIASYFPLHNYYELSNTKTKNYFKNLEHVELIKPKAKQEDYKKLYSLFMDLSDEAESTDFDSDGSCLEEETKFNYKRPWYVNIETIRNYFGEKIAIYFSFLSFYTLEMAIMALLGFIAQVLSFYFPCYIYYCIFLNLLKFVKFFKNSKIASKFYLKGPYFCECSS